MFGIDLDVDDVVLLTDFSFTARINDMFVRYSNMFVRYSNMFVRYSNMFVGYSNDSLKHEWKVIDVQIIAISGLASRYFLT